MGELGSRAGRGLAVLAAVFALAGAAQGAPSAGPATATAPSAKTPSLAEATIGLRRLDGLLPVFIDTKAGRILIQLPPADADGLSGRFLYQVYLRTGIGSTLVGLDRSQPGPTQILVFRRVGRKILAEYENDGFRAESGGPDEKRAVRESFPPSTVWAAEIVAEGADHAALADITGFLGRDAFGVAQALKSAKQGAFKLDDALSYVDPGAALAFPENLEFEATQTFAGDEPGSEIRGILPDPHRITLVVHHSLIKLPGPGYAPRLADPRLNVISALVTDFSAPLDRPLVYRLATRFRLEKTDPGATRSPVKKPIVFYVDRAAPSPIREALLEGARWWAGAFDAAGFIDAFRVEMLPEGVSPLDARFNVINWVHRQTRGWSYGQPVVDPRTGEIVRGSVLLGSQRIRQDRMIFEGLVGAARTGAGGPNDPVQISLARLRQLAVHETGHALGFDHNFAGSTYDDRASVMDYPPPRVGIVGGALDFTDAYKVGLGSWDRFSVAWLYGQFPPGADAPAALDAIARDAGAKGLRFVSDDDSRPAGAGHPLGGLWDDGPDAVGALEHTLAVRRIALDHFGLGNLPAGAPAADLKRVIVPIYLFHRYEVEAAAKLVGGVDFTYAVKGDGHEAARPVPAADQRRALRAVLATAAPAQLDLPDALVNLLSSDRPGARDPQTTVEVFGDPGTPIFDLPGAADVAADIAFSALLQPERLNRVSDLGGRDPAQLSLRELLDTAAAGVFAASAQGGHAAELRRRVRARLIFDLAETLRDARLSPNVAAQVKDTLIGIGVRLRDDKAGDAADRAQARYFSALLLATDKDALDALTAADRARVSRVPPGMPIGGGEACWFCEGLGTNRAASH